MNLSLLAPIGLAALAALLLPLLLHLQRQAEAKPTPFAALRWIGARLRPRRRVRFEEILLLLLRLLLVASVALLFARPVMTGAGADQPWVGVATTLDAVALRAAQPPATGDEDDANTLAEARWFWLAPGFPPIEDARPAPRQALASLLREMDAKLPPRTAVTVFVPDIVDGLDGERPRLSRKLDWRIVGSNTTSAGAASVSNAAQTADAVAGRAPTSTASNAPPFVIRSSDDRSEASRYVQAAARALGRPVDAANSASELPKGARQLAWLAPGPVPATIVQWTRSGGMLLLDAAGRMEGLPTGVPAWRDHEGRVLARESIFGRGRVIHLQSALSAQATPALLDAGFPDELESWLDGAARAPARATALAAQPRTGGQGYKPVPEPLDAWLALLAVALLLLERMVATRATRGLAP